MPQYTEQFTEVHQPLYFLTFQVLAPGVHTSPYVALNDMHRAGFQIYVGTMGPGAEINFQVMQATTTAGAGGKVVAGKATTELDQALGDSFDHLWIELQTEELDVDGGFDCVALRVTVTDNPCNVLYYIWGVCPRYPPVPVTFWTEIVQ
jgi:hypothetical protein